MRKVPALFLLTGIFARGAHQPLGNERTGNTGKTRNNEDDEGKGGVIQWVSGEYTLLFCHAKGTTKGEAEEEPRRRRVGESRGEQIDRNDALSP
jgi:hypothetical protein